MAFKGKKASDETKKKLSISKMGVLNHMFGKKISEETRKKMSESMKQNHPMKGKTHTLEARIKIGRAGLGRTPWNKGKGTKCSEAIIMRKSKEHKIWREAVFLRDNYTCVFCGERGDRIEPDHIKPFSIFPELRFAIDNGRTLCHSCHKTTDTYGWKLYHYQKALVQQ